MCFLIRGVGSPFLWGADGCAEYRKFCHEEAYIGMNAEIISVGTELLLGHTVNTDTP